jgi:hypothetical protein
MAQTQGRPEAPFPPGFVEQASAFLQEQAANGVQRLVCYDRDENVALVVTLPIVDPMQAAADYRKAWRIWNDGGSVLAMRREPRAGLPQNESRETLVEIPDYGLGS